jgi:tetratricopeptide (TPR) repeat protein
MPEPSRIEDLRRRIDKDPASIAFAQLAEEYRRAGQFEVAVEVARTGLIAHPEYLSARLTLGRALMQLGHFDEARDELSRVLNVAPDNLAALRSLGEIHHRQGQLPEAIAQYHRALALAPNDPAIERMVTDLSRAQAKSRDGVDRDRAKRQLAVLEQWLLAVHVTRVQRHA